MIGIVAVAYKIPSEITLRFLRLHAGRRVWLVTDDTIFHLDEHRTVKAPDMDVFSITRCSNIGICAAMDDGADVVVKTDIDCILDDAFFAWISENIRDGQGGNFRYWGVKDASTESIAAAALLPRICGTCAMTANDWRLTGGYCDAMQGYGYDDFDMVMRARTHSIKMDQLKSPKVYHIDHGEKHNRATINPKNRAFNMALRQR